jgi:hypothetical protein
MVFMGIEDWKDRPLWRNRGVLVFCAGFFFAAVPRAGWAGGIGFAFLPLFFIVLSWTRSWAWGKAADLGMRANRALAKSFSKDKQQKQQQDEG